MALGGQAVKIYMRTLAKMGMTCTYGRVVLKNNLGADLGTGINVWGELACVGIFAKMPNAAKHTQLRKVTPSDAK